MKIKFRTSWLPFQTFQKTLSPEGKENNQVIRSFWRKTNFFPLSQRNHVDLVTSLGLGIMSAELKSVEMVSGLHWRWRTFRWALLNYFIEEHIKDGYEFLLPPHIPHIQGWLYHRSVPPRNLWGCIQS